MVTPWFSFKFVSSQVLLLSLLSHSSLALPDCDDDSSLISTAWYASWHAEEGFPLDSVPWDRYTHLTYAFAETAPDVNTLNVTNPELLPQFVEAAQANGVKAKVSVGGWTGSLYWSSNVATAENRTAFVKTLLDFARNYSLDGLDFDWEYPGRQGLGCNTISPNDTANFQAFLEELRADEFGATLLLSSAVSITPFADEEGNPSADVSAFAGLLDYIAIMNYDIWGTWSATVGPNAPLNDTCAPEAARVGSAVSAVQAWTDAGIPANQIVLGVASYGHSFSVNRTSAFVNGTSELTLYPAFNASRRLLGDDWDDPEFVDACGVLNPPGGNYNFWSLIARGYLDEEGNNVTGVPFVYDTCSQTPYVYNETSEIMIAFDNADSFAAKGTFIKDFGLAGFAMWEAGGDYNSILLDSILSTAS